jgi:hypothetical protein
MAPWGSLPRSAIKTEFRQLLIGLEDEVVILKVHCLISEIYDNIYISYIFINVIK